jgi:hypothetical protein
VSERYLCRCCQCLTTSLPSLWFACCAQSLYVPAYTTISSYANYGMGCFGLRLEGVDVKALYDNGGGASAAQRAAATKAELEKPNVELPDSFQELFCRCVLAFGFRSGLGTTIPASTSVRR